MLLDVLRRELGLTSVRYTCGVGVCGACTALVDGEPISTCILLALLAEGREITTVEGLGGEHPVQRRSVGRGLSVWLLYSRHDPHSQGASSKRTRNQRRRRSGTTWAATCVAVVATSRSKTP